MSGTVEKIKMGKYTIKIKNDENPFNPREDDQIGKMICFHSRYRLGDDHDYNSGDYNGWDQMERAIMRKEKGVVILPLYLYDHSGITMNTTGFSCSWDSGQVGFIVATRENVENLCGDKRMTKAVKERLLKSLESEVEVYDQYLTGDAYGWEIYENKIKKSGEVKKKFVESCWGFFGTEYCISEAVSTVEYMIKQDLEMSVEQ